MKKRLLAFALVLGMILAMLPAQAFAIEITDYEIINSGDTLLVSVTKGGEIKYFQFIPQTSGTYVFVSGSESDPYGYLYNSDGSVMWSDDDDGDGYNFRIEHYLVAGRTYYFGAKFNGYRETGSFYVALKEKVDPVLSGSVCDGEDWQHYTPEVSGLYALNVRVSGDGVMYGGMGDVSGGNPMLRSMPDESGFDEIHWLEAGEFYEFTVFAMPGYGGGEMGGCPECGGMGMCPACGGMGMCGMCGGGDPECPDCGGAGGCSMCWGSGMCNSCGGGEMGGGEPEMISTCVDFELYPLEGDMSEFRVGEEFPVISEGFTIVRFVPELSCEVVIENLNMTNNSPYVYLYDVETHSIHYGEEWKNTAEVIAGNEYYIMLEGGTYRLRGEYLIEVDNTTVITSDIADMKSQHPYQNNMDKRWVYEASEETVLNDVTFSDRTNFADGDYLFVYDSSDNEVGRYTGGELSGQTISVPGNKFTVHLVSDSDVTDYGFGISDIKSIAREITVSEKPVLGGKQVELSSTIAGDSLYYSTDNETFELYSELVFVSADTTVYAYAEFDGGRSNTVTKEITVPKASVPTASHISGAYAVGTKISFSTAEEGMKIVYIVDGEETAYTGPIKLDENTNITVYAIGEGFAKSDEVALEYTVIKPEMPEFSEADIMGGKEITITTKSENGAIFVSIDDGEFVQYAEPVKVYDYATIKAYTRIFDTIDSEISEYNVTMRQTAAPVPNYASGAVFIGTEITLESSNEGLETEIYYTTDGSEPDNAKNRYDKGIVITESTTVKACAYCMGRAVSDCVTLEYTIRTVGKPNLREENTKGGKKIYLSSETQGAVVYYTLDGSDPKSSGTAILYDAPFVVGVNGVVISAYAKAENCLDSEVLTHTVEIGQIPAPTFGVTDEKVFINDEITLSADKIAEIRYTLDGTDPTAESMLYTDPIIISDDVTIKAIAIADGWQNSAVAEKTYTVHVTGAPYVVKTKAGNEMKIELKSETAGATIYYTLDGSVPDFSSSIFGNLITLSKDTLIKAFAVSENRKQSGVHEEEVLVRHTAEPTANVPSGEVKAGTEILLSANEKAKIYYTLDGKTPTEESKLYTNPIRITESTVIMAFAVEDDYLDSEVVTYEYSIQKTKNPSISFGEDILGGKTVVLECETEGARIYYTLDESEPNEKSTLYTGPIDIFESEYVRAIAVCDGCTDSGIIGRDMVVPVATLLLSDEYQIYLKTTDKLSAKFSEHKVYYTLSGETPDLESEVYEPGTLSFADDTTVRYFAVDYGYAKSRIATAYIILSRASTNITAAYKENYVEVSMNSVNGATIYYTTDGRDPKIYGTVYTGPIIITENTTFRTFAAAEGYIGSYNEKTVYVNRAKEPKMRGHEPCCSYYSSYYVKKGGKVTLYSTEGLNIKYTIDGSIPSAENGIEYTEPITVSEKMTVKSYCYGEGYEDSAVASFSVDIVNVFAEVDFSNVENGKNISIIPKYGPKVVDPLYSYDMSSHNFPDYTIYYTLDGKEPTEESAVYKSVKNGETVISGEGIFIDKTTTVKTLLVAENCVSRGVATEVVEVRKLKTPSFMPSDTEINKNTYISLENGEADAKIYYTTDGSEPTSDSMLYSEPFTLEENTEIRAIAIKPGMANSDILSVRFTMKRVETPTFTEKMTASGKLITLSCPTPDAKIYYTINGETPTTESTLYTEPFKLKKNATLSFVAVHDSMRDSLVVSQLIDVPFAELSAIYAGEVVASAGEYVEVPVSVQKNTGIAAYSLSLEYDNSVLTPVSAENHRGGIFVTNIDKGEDSNIENCVSFTWIGNENSYDDGELATVVFKVRDDAAPGATELVIKENGVINNLYESVDVAYIDGSVEINRSGDVQMLAVATYGMPSTALSGDTKLCMTVNELDDENIRVDIVADENSGIGAYSVSLTCNNEIFTPVGVENGELFESDIMSNVTQPDAETENLPHVTVMSCNDNNTTEDGILFSVYYRINSPAYGEQEITFSEVELLSVNGDRIDGTYEDVIIPSKPEEPTHTPGDVDASGKIDTRDIMLIRRFLAGGYGVTIVEAAADVDASGKIDTRDIMLIRRFLAGGYDVELK